ILITFIIKIYFISLYFLYYVLLIYFIDILMPMSTNYLSNFITTLKSYMNNKTSVSSLLESQEHLFIYKYYGNELETELRNEIYRITSKINTELLYLNKLIKEYEEIDTEIELNNNIDTEIDGNIKGNIKDSIVNNNNMNRNNNKNNTENNNNNIIDNEIIEYAIRLGNTSIGKHIGYLARLPAYPTKEMVMEEMEEESEEENENEEEEIVSFDF
ncbi:hypothetical protein SLOPH_463, partial [Spraguea lophii 42_110]